MISSFLHQYSKSILAVLHVLLSLLVSAHIILTKEDTKSATGWIGLVWLSPILGPILYALLGINRIHRKAIARLSEHFRAGRYRRLILDEKYFTEMSATAEDDAMVRMARLGNHLTKEPLTLGNAIQPLQNGDMAYPEMLARIDQAATSIMLSSYIFDSDQIGHEFAQKLSDAVKRGVSVRVLVDAVGARYSRPTILRRLKQLNVPAALFMPRLLPTRIGSFHLRNHRKLLLVDGIYGFTGGMNIRDGHMLRYRAKDPIQDLHFLVRGPALAALQAVFVDDWLFATGEHLVGKCWQVQLQECGHVVIRGIPSGPDMADGRIEKIIAGAIKNARRRVRIITPYFLPPESILKMLEIAALSDVKVQILLPKENNLRYIGWAMQPQLMNLLKNRCEIYLSDPPFDHSKILLVDDEWSLVGSSNWDPRSFRLNFEFNLECFNAAFNRELQDIFDSRLEKAARLHEDNLSKVSRLAALRNGFVRLFTPYL